MTGGAQASASGGEARRTASAGEARGTASGGEARGTAQAEGGVPPAAPLAGVRVLDLARFPPGAFCTELLAQLGAEVCRVDPPGSDPAMAGIGVGLSRNKKSVALDLRHPRGSEVLRRLAAWADVLVENNRPGDLDERGFGYRHAAEELPALIWCSITGFGQDGPYARWPGHDLTYTAHAGLLAALEPALPWHPQAMLAVPLGAQMAATGIVAALYERSRTGRGRQVDISLAESATWLLCGAEGAINGTASGIPASFDRRLYRCGDGRFVSVAAAEPRTWAALCTGLGLTDLAGRRPGHDEAEAVTARLAAAFAERPAAEWVRELGPAGAAVGAVNAGSDLAGDPQVAARGGLVEVEGVTVPANPIRFRSAAGALAGVPQVPPPAVGADTRPMLAAAGYSPAEVDELVGEGVVVALRA
ncbi:MAG TPA: CaiB/BaiF CoA-transferase family protein [Acidimicrobiales bacterium]|nr:CaiB/BaiF CoA-transferase family protein [Acidimicrobiales bacterium]